MHTDQYPTLVRPTESAAVMDSGQARRSQTAGLGVDRTASDSALMLRVAAGDRAALAALYDRHARAAYSVASRLVGVAAAEDVVHDAFIALVERPGSFDPDRGTFRNWFLTVIHHRCLNQLRQRGHTTADDEALAAIPDPAPPPVDTLLQALEDDSVRAALQRLPDAQQEVLVLAYYGGLSQSALAARLEVPLGTVKARMRRGLIALRTTFLGDAEPAGKEVTS
jgi:RNA polymerase sigma factor (sigma-70 family)